MKIRLIIIILTCTALQVYSQKSNGFELKGNIKGMKEGTNIYLILDKDTIAKARSSGSKFGFEGRVAGEANYYFLKLDSVVSDNYSNALWLVNGNMTLTGELSDFQNLTLNGSEPHKEYCEVMNLYKLSGADWKQKNELFKKFIEEHPNSLYVSDLIIKSSANIDQDDLFRYYERLTKRAKESYWGIELGKIIAQMRRADKASESGKIPDFFITTAEKNKVSIQELAAKSKYTLIDFWASWCSPCRAAIPNLENVYNAFQSKGFNIVGISIDKSEAAWRKAMLEDKTPWTHTLDNIEDAGKDIFGLQGIPSYMLIDQQGNIIQSELINQIGASDSQQQVRTFKDKNLSEHLKDILDELFKETK